MAYKLLAPMVPVKDARGVIHHHYLNGGGPADSGPIIPFLNDQQRAHFLGLGLVEEITPDHPDAAVAAAMGQAWQHLAMSSPPPRFHGEGFPGDANIREGDAAPPADLVEECIKTLDQLRDVDGPTAPSSAGAPTCRTALRKAGFSFGNDVIAAAVRYRKMRSA